ncbi:hypothetical protein CWI39_2383p0010, partial [Hamiltosporidium magnivora]
MQKNIKKRCCKKIVCHHYCLLLKKYTKVTVQTDAESYSTNHLLFIDDLKLLAKDSSTLKINKEKSATNDTCCEDTATFLEGVNVYKYLGIIEDSRGIP